MPAFDANRSLGLTPVTDATQFLNTPGQVGFTPDGDQLIVTTKANGSHIDVFGVRGGGRLSPTPVANASATPVPFGFTFDLAGHLVVAEAGTSSMSTYTVHQDGTLTTLASLSDAQAALCWVARTDGNTFYAANAGSGTLSGYRVGPAGHLALLGNTSVGAGPIDLDASRGGDFLYAELGGAGTIAELKVNPNGSLTSLGTVAGHATMEGIVAI